jgi:hypothetical protein
MVFANSTDFSNKVSPLINVQERVDYPNITKVIDLYHNIPIGCGCQRENRIIASNAAYCNLVNILSPAEKIFLQVKFSIDNSEIIFQDGNVILGKILWN